MIAISLNKYTVSMLAVYDSNISSPAGARAPNHVEIFARLRRRVRVDGLHQLLEDHERRQAADAAAVEGKKAEVFAGHD